MTLGIACWKEKEKRKKNPSSVLLFSDQSHNLDSQCASEPEEPKEASAVPKWLSSKDFSMVSTQWVLTRQGESGRYKKRDERDCVFLWFSQNRLLNNILTMLWAQFFLTRILTTFSTYYLKIMLGQLPTECKYMRKMIPNKIHFGNYDSFSHYVGKCTFQKPELLKY